MNMANSYKLRSAYIFFCFFAAYCFVIFNLYNIQIKKHIFFSNLGRHQYSNPRINYAPRGIIYDACGTVLASNREFFSAFLEPNALKTKHVTHDFLRNHFPHAYERLQKKDIHSSFMYIKRILQPHEIDLIASAQISDIKLCKEIRRFYPCEAVGHIVGFTDIDNQGLSGIELLYNSALRGSKNNCIAQKNQLLNNSNDASSSKQAEIEPTDIQLTIDVNLQFLIFQDLKKIIKKFRAQEGAVLVIDPNTGDIKAMAQYPAFDGNAPELDYLEYSKNRIVTESYELGSVMKVFVALACLEEGVITCDETIDCEDKKNVIFQGFPISTWKAHGLLSLSEIIQYSNNIGIAKVAQRLGHKLYDHYTRLGFGSKTILAWPGEQSGHVAHPNTWSGRSLISLSFGYEITATLLQLGLALCTLANNGIAVAPKIVKDDTAVIKKRIYESKNVNIILDMLEKTVTNGTAKKALLKGYVVRGKTGTANIAIDGVYSKKHNTYTFAGIIQKDSYKRVIVTFIKNIGIEEKLYASSIAVPLFERVAHNCIIHEKSF